MQFRIDNPKRPISVIGLWEIDLLILGDSWIELSLCMREIQFSVPRMGSDFKTRRQNIRFWEVSLGHEPLVNGLPVQSLRQACCLPEMLVRREVHTVVYKGLISKRFAPFIGRIEQIDQ